MIKQAAAANQVGEFGRMRKLTPTVRPPVRSVLAGLDEADRERLLQVVSEPLECVVDATFRLRSAEEAHTGPLTIRHPMRERDVADATQPRGRRKRSLPRGLSREEERMLFLRLNYARLRLMRVLRAFNGKRLTQTATREVLRWDRLACEARDVIVQHNLGLVPTMIERSHITGMDFSELISEGQMAMLRAVSKFDCSRGFKFSTYACRAILSSISRSVALAIRHRNTFPTEFDPELQKSDELERRRATEEQDFVDQLNRILAENLAELTVAEKRVLAERFGVGGGAPRRAPGERPKTLRQVAALFGVTKERVRQIQNKALTKLRTVLEERVFAA